MKLVSSPVVSAFALSTFQPSLPQVKMQEHQRFACKSRKFKHTAYAHWLRLSPSLYNTNTHTHIHTHTRSLPHHTQSCTANPTLTLTLQSFTTCISCEIHCGQFQKESLAETSEFKCAHTQLAHTHTQALIKSLTQLQQRHATTPTQHKSVFICHVAIGRCGTG